MMIPGTRRWMSGLGRSALLQGGALLGGVAWAGEAVPAPTGGGAGGLDLDRYHDLPPLAGVVLLVLALLPLFAGWRLLRPTLALCTGILLAMVAWHLCRAFMPGHMPQQIGLVISALIAFGGLIVGALVGWWIYQVEVAAAGALLGALVFSIPAQRMGGVVPGLVLTAIGGVIGLIAGWLVAPYWAILQTSAFGGYLIFEGLAILTPGLGGNLRLIICVGIAALATLFGLVVQIAHLRRQERSAL